MRDQRAEASKDVRFAWINNPSTKVLIDTIDWGDGLLTITGKATDRHESVFDYAKALRDTHQYENVIVADIVKEMNEDTMVYEYKFTLILY
jgi:type IV pilus assembly protein PilM